LEWVDMGIKRSGIWCWFQKCKLALVTKCAFTSFGRKNTFHTKITTVKKSGFLAITLAKSLLQCKLPPFWNQHKCRIFNAHTDPFWGKNSHPLQW
jgi:hypothetical protein